MKQRIAIDPTIHFGKPCVAGTRIPVQSVLELVREDIGFDQIIREYYPDLEEQDIRACVQEGNHLGRETIAWRPAKTASDITIRPEL